MVYMKYGYYSQGRSARTYTTFALCMYCIRHGIVNMTGFSEKTMDVQNLVINAKKM